MVDMGMVQAVQCRTLEKTCSAAQLARRMGISPAAVSYALNGRPGVSEPLRQEILNEARAAGVFVPVDERESRELVIALVLADIGNPFYSELAVSMTDAAKEMGIEVVLNTTQDRPGDDNSFIRMVIARGIQGVALTTARKNDAEVFRDLRMAHVPFVQISRRAAKAEADYIGIDYERAGYEIASHVLSHGYRSIALVVGPQNSTASCERDKGFQAAIRQAGVVLREEFYIRAGLGQMDGQKAAKYLLSLDRLPQAVICGTDALAIGLIGQFQECGVRVPDDVAVTGFDGLSLAGASLFGLTTVVQPRRLMAVRSLELLQKKIARSSQPIQKVLLPYHLCIRASCGCRNDGWQAAR